MRVGLGQQFAAADEAVNHVFGAHMDGFDAGLGEALGVGGTFVTQRIVIRR